ncbi:MAG: CocE/NonD family hydrolase [Candidatus Poribacteria bacterium]|nr:CocE/NonD family hydrolase [Candidatus Poribacteria bacterium]
MNPVTTRPKPTFLLATLLVQFFAFGLTEPSPAQNPGTQHRTMQSGQQKREYLLHIPQGYQKDQKELLALVIMLHGRSSNGQRAASRYYGWTELADKERFIAAFPTALGSPTSWKGAWPGQPTQDSQFLSELIDLLLQQLPIDKNQVFMTGHSSGGFMSFSFAVTHSNQVAAIAPVAGLLIGTQRPVLPISVISFHGMADDIVPYAQKGSSRNGMLTAQESVRFFARHNSCNGPVRSDINLDKVHIDTWSNGKDSTQVQLYSIENGNHGWPRESYHSVSATQIIWQFFKAHPRPTPDQD